MTGDGRNVADRRATRVADVHRQARPTLALAAAFTVAAVASLWLPGRAGTWLPLHLFLVGGVVLAISAAAPLFAVTWSAAPAPPATAVRAQRLLVAVGALGLVVARHLGAPTPVVAAAGLAVATGLVLLGAILGTIRRRAMLTRFHPAIDVYLAAVAFAVVGTALGVLLATGDVPAGVRARDAHLAANLLGLVGLTIAATLPTFSATQVRARLPARATPGAARAVGAVLVVATALAVVGLAVGARAVAVAGLVGHAAAVAATLALVPVPGRRALRWAGPRVVMLALGVGWWLGAVVAAAVAVAVAGGRPPFPAEVVLAIAVGGYLQILVGSLAYLGPVLHGGGHERLAAGFRTTRSWLALVAVNAAALGAVAGAIPVLGGALAVLAVDVLARAAWLVGPARRRRSASPSAGG